MNTPQWDDAYHQMTRHQYLQLLDQRHQQLDHDHATGQYTDHEHAYLRAHAGELSPIALREQVDRWRPAGDLNNWSDAATWNAHTADQADHNSAEHRQTSETEQAAAAAAAELARAAAAHRQAALHADTAHHEQPEHLPTQHMAHAGACDER